MYDYIIVGAGLYGSVFANEMNTKGKKVLVIEKRNHIGGNCFCEKIEGINVHKYGAHIFHTDNKEIWKYVNNLVDFNNYINSPLARYNDNIFNLPFNMNTFSKLWGITTPKEALNKIANQKKSLNIKEPTNLEEQALSLVGPDIYEHFIKGYTEKQWGRKCVELPSFIIKRLPVRFTYDNNYFNDRYQGIPIGGYNQIFNKLLEGIDVILNTDFFENRDYYENNANKIVYTGMIDKFFDFKYGKLEYRSLDFTHEVLDEINYQGNAVVNYTDVETPFTRIIEHKHFEFGTQNKTVITKEYPIDFDNGNEPYYPINDTKNNILFNKYREEADLCSKYIFGGRLANYKYYDMDDVIKQALEDSNNELLTSEI